MDKWVVLLRGINVGGNNLLPMAALSKVLESMGCEQVKTYIQSGNVVLEHDEKNSRVLADKIVNEIHQNFNFTVNVLVISAEDFVGITQQNPYKQAELEPKTLHVFFLAEQAKSANLETLSALKAPSESYKLTKQAFYLHAPDGIGRSKLVAKVEKCLAVPCTARNWNTVNKLLSLLAA